MDSPPSLPKRKRPPHFPVVEMPNRSNVVFLTVCTMGRRPHLANEAARRHLVSVWTSADGWMVGKFLLMPDHVHLFCAPSGPEAPALGRWVAYWKSLAARTWSAPSEKLWQRDFWDTQIRDAAHYREKWTYMAENPVRAKLVEKAEDWPWTGEIHPFRWHDPT